MDLFSRLTLLSVFDLGAVAFVFASWLLIGWMIEHPRATRPSVTVLMAEYRRAWFRELVTREPRIFDAQLLASLRQGTSFFASSCILAIGGVLALIGNTERLTMAAADLTQAAIPALIWQIKLFMVVLFLTSGFLRFVWANRLFGYCSVMMGAVPNDITDPTAYPRAAQGAELNIRAAWNFNRGLRSLYFALSSLAWLIGPEALVLATAFTFWVLWEREFASIPRKVILGDYPILSEKAPKP